MTAEPTAATYTDTDIKGYIEAYPCVDERGEVPYTWDTSTDPPTKDTNADWVATYDLPAAAADIWSEKAAALATGFDFSTDGGSYHRSQAYQQAQGQARYWRARRKTSTITLAMHPEPDTESGVSSWVLNMPEDD